MSLPQYGVAIGTFKRFEQEPPDNFGKWFHGFIFLDVNGIEYKCAVDVNSPTGDFTYMMLGGLDPALFTNISSLANGYHSLAHTETSGAIDFNRSNFVNQAKGCLSLIFIFINNIFGSNERVWKTNVGNDVLNILRDLVTGSSRIYVFGAPFTSGHGMHDVHYNQGDPAGSQWYAANGIWQDGCVIVQKPGEDKLKGYFGKFITQSFTTDNNGNPI
jgi:Uncharacterized conserved protein (DUF2278)